MPRYSGTDVTREKYRIGVPFTGSYTEIINSDASIYGGEDIGNLGKVVTEKVASHGYPQSLSLTVPPLGILILRPLPA